MYNVQAKPVCENKQMTLGLHCCLLPKDVCSDRSQRAHHCCSSAAAVDLGGAVALATGPEA